MPASWSDYRLEWRCSCGLEWQSPIRSGAFRFHCPECRKAMFDVEAAVEPGNCQIRLLDSDVSATVAPIADSPSS